MPAIFLALIIVLTSPSTNADEVRVTDDLGRAVTLDRPAQRIVSLAPHITEMLFAAGAGQTVVGAVNYSNYPPEASRLPQVGGYESLNIESIFALQPELVVAWHSGNLGPQLKRLKALGIPVYYTEPRSFSDIAGNIERLGVLAGSADQAGAAADAFRQRLASLKTRYSGRSPLRTFYQAWHQPLMTINGGQLINEVITLCGGHNIFSELETTFPTINIEAVIDADPEVIIASGMAKKRPEWLDNWRDWPQITAVKNDHLFFIEPDIIQRHTPRILDGAQTMCRQLEQARSTLNTPRP